MHLLGQGVSAKPVIALRDSLVGVTSGSYSNSYTLTAAQETQLCGPWYVNIHISASPAGETGGQLTEAAPSSV